MKVVHLNQSDVVGGAARAAYRIHKAVHDAGVDSSMWVNDVASGDWTVHGPQTIFAKALKRIRAPMVAPIRRALNTTNLALHSPAVLRSSLVKRINKSDADLVHLHWVQGEMLSVADIGRIDKPIVWTLHDMWAFCGAEHYTQDLRWRDGYHRNNRPSYESGFDLNRWTWERKRRHWQKPFNIVGDSNWLTKSAAQSALLKDMPNRFIYYPLDTEKWKPMSTCAARELLGLPMDVPLLGFGAMGGGRDPRKGFDLLLKALEHLRGEIDGLELVIFGQLAPRSPPDIGFRLHYSGHLHDDLSLRVLYNAVDALVVPSRQEAFGQTASEAHACGTPVVAFDIGGLPDTVMHKKSGYLARALDTDDLASGIKWVLANSQDRRLGVEARNIAKARFSPCRIAAQYLDVYERAAKQ